MSTHLRQHPKLPPPLDQMWREIIYLRQGFGMTNVKLASATTLLGVRAVQDEGDRLGINPVASLQNVVECLWRQQDEEARTLITMALNFDGQPELLGDRRVTLAGRLGTHVDTLRADEDEALISLLIQLESSRWSPCRRYRPNPDRTRNPRLFGRDGAIHDALRIATTHLADDAVGVVFVHGMPGIGKTAVARELLRRMAQQLECMPSEVLCRGASVEDVLFALSIDLMVDRSVFHAMRSTSARVVALKRAIGAHPVVLLFDDVDDPTVASEVIGLVEQGVVVITSRNAGLLDGVEHHPIRLAGLDEQASAELVASTSGLSIESDDVWFRRVFRATGGHPYALKLLGGRIRRGQPLEQLAESLVSRPSTSRRRSTPNPVLANFQLALSDYVSHLSVVDGTVLNGMATHPAGSGDLQSLANALRLEAPAVAESLQVLWDAHLLDDLDSSRWRLHPLIHEYLARHEAGILPRLRLLNHYGRILSRAEKALRTSSELAWLAELDRCSSNMDELLEWAVTRGFVRTAAPIAARLGWYWTIRGHERKGRAVYRSLLARVSARNCPIPVSAGVYSGAAWLATNQADYSSAVVHFSKAVDQYEQAGRRAQKAAATVGLAYALWGTGNLHASSSVASTLLSSSYSRAIRASAHNALGLCASHAVIPENSQAREHFLEACRLRYQIGDEWGFASSEGNLLEVEIALGADISKVGDRLQAVLAIREGHGDQWASANCHNLLGFVLMADRPAQAVAHYVKAYALSCDFENPLGTATSLVGLSNIALQTQLQTISRRMLVHAFTLLQNVNVPIGPAHRDIYAKLCNNMSDLKPRHLSPDEWFREPSLRAAADIERLTRHVSKLEKD